MFERIKWRFQFDINTPLYFEREWINTLKSLLASTGYIVNFPCFPSISSFHPVFFCFSSVVVSSQSECGSYHLKMKHTCLCLSLLCAFTGVFCAQLYFYRSIVKTCPGGLCPKMLIILSQLITCTLW